MQSRSAEKYAIEKKKKEYTHTYDSREIKRDVSVKRSRGLQTPRRAQKLVSRGVCARKPERRDVHTALMVKGVVCVCVCLNAANE